MVGWQIMALKSGMMAYLTVNPVVFERAKVFLEVGVVGQRRSAWGSAARSATRRPGRRPPLTAVGLLCCQYMGMPRTDPAMIEGTALLMANQPDADAPQHVLLVLCHPSDAQPARAPIGTPGTGRCGGP